MSPPPPTTVEGAAEQAKWFAEQVHPHESSLKAYLHRSFQVQDVEDVVQESYLRMLKARAAQPIQSAKAFLFQVARHVTLDLLRRGKASPIETVGDLSALPVMEDKRGVAESVSMKEKVQVLAGALVTLPPACREVVMLRKLKGLSRKETAARLGIDEKTVDEQLARGVKKLGKYLRQHGVQEHYEK